MPRTNPIVDILGAIIFIVALFGVLYMLVDPMTGIVLIGVCGVMIFLRAFIQKHSR